jgi:hexosaminidase
MSRGDDPAARFPGLNLIPWPQTVRLNQGRLTLTAASRIVVGQEELKPLAHVLAHEVSLLTGLRLQTTTDADQPGDVVLKLDRTIEAGEPILAVRKRELVRTREGAYRLTIDDRAVVAGFDKRAVAEGSSTLLQAFGRAGTHVSLPRLQIDDWPHADYCAMMVDVARQDHPMAWLRKMIDVCRFYRVRYLHLHLTDDQGWTFPSTKYPQLGCKNQGAHGGLAPKVYVLEELKQLVAYADVRGVTLVPELEMPGHSGAALRSLPEVFDAINPETGQPVGMGCMNMANEALYSALDTIIGEMCDVFRSSPYFHIGGDEVSMGRVALHPEYKAFMEKHGLKNDAELGRYYVTRVNEIVKKHGKKALKWEGLANEASKDIIVVAWDNNNQTAGHLTAKGFTTITCPWHLGVPWEDWTMYICNGSRLKKGDAILGATLVAWEQPPETHLVGVRNVASRQERTWNPDHPVTAPGFAARFQALDAAVGKLIAVPVKPYLDASFAASAGTCDWLDPVFAFDGSDATYYRSENPPAAGDHFTVTLKEPTLVYGVEVHTGINNKGLLDGGEVQVSQDGTNFTTVATLKQGIARTRLAENRVRAVRLLARTPQAEQLVIREIKLSLMVELSGVVKNPAQRVGEGNVAVLRGDTTFAQPLNDCAVPVINQGFTLMLAGGGNPGSYRGPISGTGQVATRVGASDRSRPQDAAITLAGKEPNTFEGTWSILSGRLVLDKEPRVQAIGGTIVVGGPDAIAGIVWNHPHQVQKSANIRVAKSAFLNLNGFRDAIDNVTLDDGARIMTDGASGGGVLAVRTLMVAGKPIASGVYSSASPWLQGSGYVLVGGASSVNVSGNVEDPKKEVGAGNIAMLTGAANVHLSGGECTIPVDTGAFPLSLSTGGRSVRYTAFITGGGPVRIDAAAQNRAERFPLEIASQSANSYRGATYLVRGVLKLSNPGGEVAIPGDLDLGGWAPDNAGDGVIWGADAQIAPRSIVTISGSQPSFLDLAGRKTAFAKLVMSLAATVRTGDGGALNVKQLYIDGKRMPDGDYRSPLAWLQGSGTVAVDARVNVAGRVSDLAAQIGTGNFANLTGNTEFGYPLGDCSVDIITNGHTVTLNSGDGNPLACSGVIAGTGEVVLLMGPSHTDYKDAPLRITGDRANTTTGRFYVRKGRVQLEKSEGVDAISGDVVVGGQGFNDCLYWARSNQIKDSASITLTTAGNNGAAYLHLNGCRETVASLTMMSANTIKTDSATGTPGVLTVQSLTLDGNRLPAGTYTSANTRWIEGKGQVLVQR